MEKTLVLLKPDTIQRSLIGRIISRFEDKGLTIAGIKMIQLDDAILSEHYSHLTDKPFFSDICKFMKSTPVVAVCISGDKAISQVRKMLGATNSQEAENGTIRMEFGNSTGCNLVHASDPEEDPQGEVDRFFKPEELFDYEKVLNTFIYG